MANPIAKKQRIDSLRDGDRVEDVFAVKLKKGFSQYSKGYMFHLLLTDSSGHTIDYKYWGGADQDMVRSLYDSIPPDGVVYVQGKTTTYLDKIQISTNEPDTITPLKPGGYDPADFIKPARSDVEGMWQLLQHHVSSVQDAELKATLKAVFDDPYIGEKFKKHPGAIEVHHNWIGGLLQHTLEVAEYVITSRKLFPDLDQDMLIAGALLHDIGKLEEIEVTARIKGSKTGQLQGHIALGYAHISKVMDRLKISWDKRDRLLHIILAHHGSLEYGSPKPPMTPEAYAVYYGDELSSKLSEITDYVRWARENTDDQFMYHKRHQHNILIR